MRFQHANCTQHSDVFDFETRATRPATLIHVCSRQQSETDGLIELVPIPPIPCTPIHTITILFFPPQLYSSSIFLFPSPETMNGGTNELKIQFSTNLSNSSSAAGLFSVDTLFVVFGRLGTLRRRWGALGNGDFAREN